MGGPAIIAEKKYTEFDNFHPCDIYINGWRWDSAEHFYQAMKSFDPAYHLKISVCGKASTAWKLGQECELRPDWEEIKVDIMFRANLAKFSQSETLWKLLIATGDSPIIFTRSTPFWNENNGKILEEIREILRRHPNV